MKRVLFIAKRGQVYSDSYGCQYTSSGLLNSAKFVVDMLEDHGVRADLVHVVDNNDIDREVTRYNPDVVIIEALWVVPEKFKILHKLHPRVQWIVRVHSEIPFLAQEGVAVGWLFEYLKVMHGERSVKVAFNSLRTAQYFANISGSSKILWLPNYFPVENIKSPKGTGFHVGCFGAIRPLKNQLMQAMAAIRYANLEGRNLHFHMNTSRVEGGKEVLKNIRSLFKDSWHTFVEHEWLSHGRFQHLLSKMDLAMCVSFSETFCIVAADAVSVGIPLVCSTEVPWSSSLSHAEPTDMDSIVCAMYRVGRLKRLSRYLNTHGLKKYDQESVKIWLEFLKEKQ